jgi:hypothetical protein
MKLTRTMALGAVGLGLLAVPFSGTALATPASSPPRPIAVTAMCPPLQASTRPAPVASATPVPVKRIELPPTSYFVACCGTVAGYGKVPGLRAVVRWAACPRQNLVFDMPAGGRIITEVRGPRLIVHEPVVYRGGIYTVTSVHGTRFTLDFHGKPFVNHGAAIRDGRALILRAPVALVVCSPRPLKSK